MKFFVTFILLLGVVSAENKLIASEIKGDDRPINSECATISAQTPSQSAKWTSQVIFPVEVCGIFQGPLDVCSSQVKTGSILSLTLKAGEKTLRMEHEFIFKAQENAPTPTLYCSTFKVCDILDVLKSITPSVELTEVELMGEVSVPGVKRREGTTSEIITRFKAVVRGTAITVSSKTAKAEFDVYLNPYSIIRSATFCDNNEDYKCINEFTNSKSEGIKLTPENQKMMLLKEDTLPTCDFKDDSEGTKLHMTTFMPAEESTCDWMAVAGACAGRVTIEDKSEAGNAAHLTVTMTALLLVGGMIAA